MIVENNNAIIDITIAIYEAAKLAIHYNQNDTAKDLFEIGLRLDPTSLQLLINQAAHYFNTCDFAKAEIAWKKIKESYPNNEYSPVGLSYLYHMIDRTKEGFAEYENRKMFLHMPKGRDCTKDSVWNGEDLKGKKIMVIQEGGFGDMIQFARFIPDIVARGAECSLLCVKTLAPLLKDIGIKQFYHDSNEVDCVPDYFIPILSFPHLLGVDKQGISGKPYLKADHDRIERWSNVIESRTVDHHHKKIGIVWSGNPQFVRAAQKVVPIHMWKDLLATPNCDFYSLQTGRQENELATQPFVNDIIRLSDGIVDFADTAAIIENLDLVISIDTAVCHLAGALGKPVWTMLHNNSCWRWQYLGEKSYWYDSMRLFRQKKAGDWSDVLSEVKTQLNLFASIAD